MVLRRNAERFSYDVNSKKPEIYFKKCKPQYLNVSGEQCNRELNEDPEGDFVTCVSKT